MRTIKENKNLEQTILMAENESCQLIDQDLDIFTNPKAVKDEFHQEEIVNDPKASCTTNTNSSEKMTKTNKWMHKTFSHILRGKSNITTKIFNSASLLSCSIRNVLSLEKTCDKQQHITTKKKELLTKIFLL